jgi:hypothetical protein
LKGKASKDPFSEREAANKNIYPRKAVYSNYNNNSDFNANNEPECNNNSNTSNDPGSDNNILFDSKDDASNDGTANKDMDRYGCADSSYNSDGTDVTIIEDTDKCYMTELDTYG